MILKIFVTGDSSIDKLDIAKKIIKKNDDLSIAPKFTNDISHKDKIGDDYIYYMDSVDVDLSYKNNAFLYAKTENYITTGITLDSFYNNDVFPISIYEFNTIADCILYSYDSLIIWVDTKKHRKSNDEDSQSVDHLIERTNELTTLYFLDEEPEHIAETVINYINGTIEERQNIIEENS